MSMLRQIGEKWFLGFAPLDEDTFFELDEHLRRLGLIESQDYKWHYAEGAEVPTRIEMTNKFVGHAQAVASVRRYEDPEFQG